MQTPHAQRVQIGPGQFLFVTASRPVTELKGMFGKPTKAVSIEGMNGPLRLAGLRHVARALRAYSAGNADFADGLIERAAVAAGCSQTMTFDVAGNNHRSRPTCGRSFCLLAMRHAAM